MKGTEDPETGLVSSSTPSLPLYIERPKLKQRKPVSEAAKTLMVQGRIIGGKECSCHALCRIFKQQGLKVTPSKRKTCR